MAQARVGRVLVALALAVGCGAEATTARIAALEPFDPLDCEYEQFTDGAGERFVAHPLFGCVRAADLVRIVYDLAPDADGRPRRGYRYGNGNGTAYTPRSVVSGLAVGSTFPASHEVRDGFFSPNGAVTIVAIPELDDRARAAVPPLEERECVGMRSAHE